MEWSSNQGKVLTTEQGREMVGNLNVAMSRLLLINYVPGPFIGKCRSQSSTIVRQNPNCDKLEVPLTEQFQNYHLSACTWTRGRYAFNGDWAWPYKLPLSLMWLYTGHSLAST